MGTEDTLEPVEGGCRYRVTVTITPTLPLLGPLVARASIRTMLAGRRRFMERLRAELGVG